METKRKELLQIQLVQINIPNPGWYYNPSPKIVFGKHSGSFKKDQNYGWQRESKCQGTFLFFQGGYEAILNPHKAIQIFCTDCHLVLPFSKENWQKAMIEWMIMATGTNLKRMEFISRSPHGEFSTIYSVIRDKIKICKPGNIYPPLLRAIETHPFTVDTAIFKRGAYWKDYEIVTALPFLINETEHDFLHVASMLIATQLENNLQTAVINAGRLACSASEEFHPKTRRKKGGGINAKIG
jgi:hypothetical protein